MSPRHDKPLSVELWGTSKLTPYERNPRVIPESAIAKVAKSIKAFGFRTPLLVDKDGVIIAGHTRLLAAKKLGLSWVPVIVCDDLSPEKARALRLADNRTAQESTWEYEALNLELEALSASGLDARLCGFDPDELAGLDLPVPHRQPETEGFGVIIDCDSRDEQGELLARFEEEGLRARAV